MERFRKDRPFTRRLVTDPSSAPYLGDKFEALAAHIGPGSGEDNWGVEQ